MAKATRKSRWAKPSKTKRKKATFVSPSILPSQKDRTRAALNSLSDNVRKGSQPDIHKKLVDRIVENKTLRSVGRQGVTSLAQHLRGPGAAAVMELLPAAWTVVNSRLSTGASERPGAPKGGDTGFKPSSMVESVHPPVQRNLVDNKTYYTKFEVHEGEPSRMLLAAKKNFPSSSKMIWETGSEYVSDMIFQCHGINQTGFWQPFVKNTNGVANAPTTYNQVNKMTVTSRDVYLFLRNCLSIAQLTAANAMKDTEDLLFNVEGTTNKMVVRNASELTPCICTAYILTNKMVGSGKYPWEYASSYSDFPTGYISSPVSRDIKAYDGATGTAATTILADQAARLGFTPQMSPLFNNTWAVHDVVKSPVLNPGDQWNFTFKQHYASPTSYHKLKNLYGSSPSQTDGVYCPGDYEILLQFQGAPGFAINQLHTDAGPIRVSTNSNPCMITCTQSRSIQYRFADSINSTVRTDDSFVSDVMRVIDTSPRISPYHGETNYEYRAVAMTETESKVANKLGIGSSLDD